MDEISKTDTTPKETTQIESNSPRKLSKGILIAGGALLLVVAVVVGCKVLFKGNITAATMRLIGYEGEISLQDESENELPITENAKLYSGNVLSTKISSKGYVSLDDTKLVTLEELSRADFTREGKNLALHLSKGSLFFNVKEKLNDDESFDIRTSTMLIGIRGTSGYVSILTDTCERVWITDGKTHVNVTHPVSGAVDETDVEGGECLTVLYNEDGTIDMQIDDITYIGSLPSEAVAEIFADKELLDRVSDTTGWSEEDIEERSQIGKTYVAIETKAVDGFEHAAYYGYENIPDWMGNWLDDLVDSCDDKDWDEAFSLLCDGNLDRIWQLGIDDHFYYNGYKFYYYHAPDANWHGGTISILPESEGMGYYLRGGFNGDEEDSSKHYGYCACTDGMYNGDAYFCYMTEWGAKGNVHITNGLYDGEYVEENGNTGLYVKGKCVEGYDITDVDWTDEFVYASFPRARSYENESAIEGAVKAYSF